MSLLVAVVRLLVTVVEALVSLCLCKGPDWESHAHIHPRVQPFEAEVADLLLRHRAQPERPRPHGGPLPAPEVRVAISDVLPRAAEGSPSVISSPGQRKVAQPS